MNLFDLFVKIGVDDQASGKLKELSGKLGNGLKTAAKIGTVAVSAAASGITALTTAAVNNYAEYEQLVGGVETLFGAGGKSVEEYAASVGKSVSEIQSEYDTLMRSQEAVLSNAANAYKTAGMSANEYMSTVTSFSASLLQSLGGDTETAAKYANQALTDMSDNANKMGTDMGMIQNAYQGFAKANYTMLDNLKLGYGGTKEEMERLIADAAELSDTVDAQDMSFANIVKAINVVQTEMGITGTTAKEAASTIQGSVGMMRSAWGNLVTGIADENANLDELLTNLVESVGTVVQNLIPKIEVALGSIASLIEKLAPVIVEALPSLVSQIVPSLISAATGMVNSIVEAIPSLLDTLVMALVQNGPMLIDAAVKLIEQLIHGLQDNYQVLVDGAIKIVTTLSNGILNMLPEIVKLGLDLIVSLAYGIADSLPELVPTIIDVIMQIVDILTDPEQLSALLDAALAILTELAFGLVDAIPQLVDATLTIIENLVDFLLDPKNIQKLLQAALEIVMALAVGIIKSIPRILESIFRLTDDLVSALFKTDWNKVGADVINGVWEGLKRMWGDLEKWFTNSWDSLVGSVKDLLGIHSPSRVFAGIGENMALGIGKGWEDEFGDIQKDIDKSLSFEDPSMNINTSIQKVSAGTAGATYGGTTIGNITINIDGGKYKDEQALAEAVAQELQNMTDRRAAVYA